MTHHAVLALTVMVRGGLDSDLLTYTKQMTKLQQPVPMSGTYQQEDLDKSQLCNGSGLSSLYADPSEECGDRPTEAALWLREAHPRRSWRTPALS